MIKSFSKVHLFSALLFIPLFCLFFSSKVYAINFTINPDLYDIFENDDFISLYDELKDSTYYQVGFSSPYYYSISTDNNYDYTCAWEYGSMTCTSSIPNGLQVQYYNSDFSLGATNTSSVIFNRFTMSSYDRQYLLFSSNKWLYVSPYVLNISDGTNTWSCTPTDSVPCEIPTLLDFYTMYYGSPFPDTPPSTPDPVPVLTSFYTTTISKIAYLSEFFSSNLIYLAIISIFIFITILLLIKRRLF